MKTSLLDDKYQTNDHNSKDKSNYQDAAYWLLMYEELEEQMKQMMKMTLTLIDKEVMEKEKEVRKELLAIQAKVKEAESNLVQRNKKAQKTEKELNAKIKVLEAKLKNEKKEYKKQISLLKGENKKLDFEKRKLEQFKHRVSVTLLGKINLAYIQVKKGIKGLIAR